MGMFEDITGIKINDFNESVDDFDIDLDDDIFNESDNIDDTEYDESCGKCGKKKCKDSKSDDGEYDEETEDPMEEAAEFAPDSNATKSVDNGDKDAKISVPSKTELTDDVYNQALSNLKKSLKESVEVMEMLENATIIHKSIEDQQTEFAENAIADILLEAYDNGPMFESVQRSDKKELKEIVKALRPKVDAYMKDNNINYKSVKRLLGGAHIDRKFKGYAWQTIGAVSMIPNDMKALAKTLNSKFKEDLGGYRIVYNDNKKHPIDLNGKNIKSVGYQTYGLIIDHDLPEDLKNNEE